MRNNWSVRYRPVLIIAGLVVILGISMAFAPVRAIANSFLGLFRVQQIQVVQVNQGIYPSSLATRISWSTSCRMICRSNSKARLKLSAALQKQANWQGFQCGCRLE